MMFRTHLAFGVLSALIMLPLVPSGNKYLFFALVLMGSLLPDIDTPSSKLGSRLRPLSSLFRRLAGHRAIFHSLFFAMLLAGLVWYYISDVYGTALFIGYMSHLLIDSLTKTGINFLHPFLTLRISGFVATGTITETFVLTIIMLLILIVIL